MTKKEQILKLWAKGKDRREIAAAVGCSLAHVNVAVWNEARPGYKAQWMREQRKSPRVRAADREYSRNKWATDPEYRERQREYMRQWREANRERINAYQRNYHRRRQQEASA